MTKVERGVNDTVQGLEQANVFKPPLALIKELKAKRIIAEKSPLWWGIDYSPDPREYMDFSDFKKTLVHLGSCPTTTTEFFSTGYKTIERDVYLYPKPAVPMSILNLQVLGQTLPFLVTARPYHEKEKFDQPGSLFLIENPDIKKLPEYVRAGKTIDLWNHFYPHLRGLFAGAKGNNLFWYPVNFNVFWYEFGEKVREALDKRQLGFLGEFEPTYREGRTYSQVWNELTKKKDLFDPKPAWTDFESRQVSRDEFIAEKDKEENLTVYYPVKVPNIEETLPVLISNRTHTQSKERKPVVLGVYAENGGHGYTHRGGILRIKDPEIAKHVSREISTDFGMPIDAVLFIPQKGRPKYERISGT